MLRLVALILFMVLPVNAWAASSVSVEVAQGGDSYSAAVRYKGQGTLSTDSSEGGEVLDLQTHVRLRDGRTWWGVLEVSFTKPILVSGDTKIVFDLKSGTDRRIHTLGIVAYNQENVKLEPSYINFDKQWQTFEYHLSQLQCEAVRRIEFLHMASGVIPGEESSERYLIRNIRFVEQHDNRPDGWRLASGAAGLSRIGYHPDDDKLILLPGASGKTFRVVAENGDALLQSEGVPSKHGNIEVDVSDIRQIGRYWLKRGDTTFASFDVVDNRAEILDLVINSFEYMMSGVKVNKEAPFGHEAAHLDNCRTMLPQVINRKIWPNAKEHLARVGNSMDLVGGWYDAGIVDQYVDNTAMITYAMATAFLLDNSQVEAYSQAKWGVSWLLKSIMPSYELIHHTRKQMRWTDNVVGNGDDRYVDVRGCWPDKAMLAVSALAKSAQAIKMQGEDYNPIKKMATSVFAKYDKQISESFYKGMVNVCQYSLLASIELYALTRDKQYKVSARKYLDRILEMQAGAPYHHFYKTKARKKVFRSLDGQGLIAFSLMRFCEVFGDESAVKKAVSLWLDKYLVASFELSGEFGIPAFGLYHANNSDDAKEWWGKPWDPNVFKFKRDHVSRAASEYWFSAFGRFRGGNNRVLLSSMLVLNQASRMFKRSKYRTLSDSARQWLFGKNPYEAVMVRGVASPDVAVFSIMLGQVPGMFIKGINSFDGDTPFYSSNINYPQKEIWGVVGALYILAESNLK